MWDLLPGGPCLGGAPANVAFHVVRAGGHGALISCVGRDELGERALQALGSAGVDVAWVGRTAAHPTGVVDVVFDGSEPRYSIGDGAAWDQIEIPAGVERELALADALCFGTLAARTDRVSTRLVDLARALRDLRAPSPPGRLPRPLLALDLNLRPPHVNVEFIRSVLPLVDLLKLNEEEHAWLQQQGLGETWRTQSANLELVALTRGPTAPRRAHRG